MDRLGGEPKQLLGVLEVFVVRVQPHSTHERDNAAVVRNARRPGTCLEHRGHHGAGADREVVRSHGAEERRHSGVVPQRRRPREHLEHLGERREVHLVGFRLLPVVPVHFVAAEAPEPVGCCVVQRGYLPRVLLVCHGLRERLDHLSQWSASQNE